MGDGLVKCIRKRNRLLKKRYELPSEYNKEQLRILKTIMKNYEESLRIVKKREEY